MEQVIPITGSTHRFSAAITSHLETHSDFHCLAGTHTADASRANFNFSTISDMVMAFQMGAIATLSVIVEPNNRGTLTITADDKHWEQLNPLWLELRATLIEYKIIKSEAPQAPLQFDHESTERDLRNSFYKITAHPRTPEWWDEVAMLFQAYKKVFPRYTNREFTYNVLGYNDPKHVGKKLRERKPPKTIQNRPS